MHLQVISVMIKDARVVFLEILESNVPLHHGTFLEVICIFFRDDAYSIGWSEVLIKVMQWFNCEEIK